MIQKLFAFVTIVIAFHAQVVHGELIVNGGFEVPIPPTGTFLTIPAGSGNLAGWTVVNGSVDTVATGLAPSFEESQALDLDGAAAGTIAQSFPTVSGSSYTLTFAYGNNPLSRATIPATAMIDIISSNSTVLLNDSITHNTSTVQNMDYTLFSSMFVAASNATTVQFTSQSPANSVGGVFLDAVSVMPVPEPCGTWAISVGLFFAACSRRKTPRNCH